MWFSWLHKLFSHEKINEPSKLIMKVTCAELQIARLTPSIATFKVEKGGLPDPHGPLATVPSSSIASEFKLLGIESLTSLPDRKKGRIICQVYA